VPIGWVYLVVRAVQDEPLVGDRQFWVTRPYEWKNLLAAKLLFVVVFVNLPIFVVEVILLEVGGFRPWTFLPGLMMLQLLWQIILVLPSMTFATVTSSLGQFLLASLCVVLYLIGGSILNSYVPNNGISGAASIPDTIESVVALGAGLAVIFSQYARRRTTRARLLLGGAALAILVVMAASPYKALIRHAYPTGTGTLPVQFALDPAKPKVQETEVEKGKTHIRVPLLVSGIAKDSLVGLNGVQVTVRSSDGTVWNSPWISAGGMLSSRSQHSAVEFSMENAVFERMKTEPVAAHLTFALLMFQSTEEQRITHTDKPFGVPGNGRCLFDPGWIGGFRCVFPLTTPLLQVTVKSEEITCAPREDEKPVAAGAVGEGWIWGHDQGAEFGISPVVIRTLYINDWGQELNEREVRTRICAGTPLTLRTVEEVGQKRTEVDLPNILLTNYQLKDVSRGSSGWGFAIGR
ncbi:MAG TPA: hypothetical protein VMS96_00760, partial [Terriglobales bacterium]|nr:hypothetical protein [Terriglobales bacterium]